ncbi:MAG: response regulator transcription factor [Paludibacter sp.]|nr:response regulator transcription factor [Paludibacter sp.]
MKENAIKILLCEESEDLGVIISEYLKSKNYHVDFFTDAESGFKSFEKNKYALCILDIKLFENFELINKMHVINPESYILILLPKKYLLPDRKHEGNEGYLSKPFSVNDLASVIKIKNRNKNKRNHDKTKNILIEPKNLDVYQVGDYTFEVQRKQLILKDKTNKLTTKEAALLHLLAKNANSVTDRNIFIDTIWNYEGEYYSKSRSMDVYICKLRKQLEKDPNINIVNIHGKGYNMIAKVKKTDKSILK